VPRTPIEEQRRYQENTECEYWRIFKGLNDWLIVDLSPSAGTNMDDVQEACYDIIRGLCKQMSQQIKIGWTGMKATEDTAMQGGVLPHTVGGDRETYLFDPTNKEGALVVRGKYHALIKGASFDEGMTDDESVLMHVQAVLS
jgi:hypothetical protein